MRCLLRSVYRDLYKYRVVSGIRRARADTRDEGLIQREFEQALQATRFLGVGNPSESGTHLLYFFRQENGLSSELFIHTHEIFDRVGANVVNLGDPNVRHFVFLDDFCGSGKQATIYSQKVIADLKRLDPRIRTSYLVLFGLAEGLEEVRQNTLFDDVDSVFELDKSYRCFDDESRYFKGSDAEIRKDFALDFCRRYGGQLWPAHPLGFMSSQLLIGFHHNTPDNSLPIFWYEGKRYPSWSPVFRRYPKLYNWGGI